MAHSLAKMETVDNEQIFSGVNVIPRTGITMKHCKSASRCVMDVIISVQFCDLSLGHNGRWERLHPVRPFLESINLYCGFMPKKRFIPCCNSASILVKNCKMYWTSIICVCSLSHSSLSRQRWESDWYTSRGTALEYTINELVAGGYMHGVFFVKHLRVACRYAKISTWKPSCWLSFFYSLPQYGTSCSQVTNCHCLL